MKHIDFINKLNHDQAYREKFRKDPLSTAAEADFTGADIYEFGTNFGLLNNITPEDWKGVTVLLQWFADNVPKMTEK
jgi:hypothetical protein